MDHMFGEKNQQQQNTLSQQPVGDSLQSAICVVAFLPAGHFRYFLSVYLSQSGEAWERVNGMAASWFELVGSSLRKEAKRWQYYR